MTFERFLEVVGIYGGTFDDPNWFDRTPENSKQTPKYCASLDENIQNKIKDGLRENLPTGPDGEISLAARAWAVKGRVPL